MEFFIRFVKYKIRDKQPIVSINFQVPHLKFWVLVVRRVV